MKTYQVYPPNCFANPGDRYLCEVRKDGWIADWQLFPDKKSAENWGNNHTGETSKQATNEIANMAIRWASK